MRQNIKIEVMNMGVVVKTYQPKTFAEAKKLWYQLQEPKYQYARLVVNRRAYTIAEGEKFFGPMEEKVKLKEKKRDDVSQSTAGRGLLT